MTGLAQRRHMSPGECKPRHRMVELFNLPGLVAVAGLASCARLTFVLVVFFMAADAFDRRFSVATQILVTGHALDRCLGMPIAQDKLGSVMVKTPDSVFPVAFQVAVGTFFAQAGVVLVIFLVASDAFPWGFLEHRAFVAGFALHLGVLAQQRETALVMVEAGGFFPAALAVAASAILA